MKSIKEKAEEYGKTKLTNWGVVSTERVEGFEAGANYVLDIIDNIIEEVSEVYPKFHQGTIIQGRLERLIEQLKK